MKLKTKVNIVGTIAILCVIAGLILAFLSIVINQNILGIIIALLIFVYSCQDWRTVNNKNHHPTRNQRFLLGPENLDTPCVLGPTTFTLTFFIRTRENTGFSRSDDICKYNKSANYFIELEMCCYFKILERDTFVLLSIELS